MNWKIIILILSLLLAAACSSGQNLEEAPEIHFGEDICHECSMIINEERHAASYVTTTGDVRLFDDIGGMLAYDSKHHENVHVYWVHNYLTADWLQADESYFVLSHDLVTPMGWGLAAFDHKAEADNFKDANGGTVTSWRTLIEAVAAGELDPGSLSAHVHEHEGDQQDNDHSEEVEDDHEMEQNHEMDHNDPSG